MGVEIRTVTAVDTTFTAWSRIFSLGVFPLSEELSSEKELYIFSLCYEKPLLDFVFSSDLMLALDLE